MMTFLDEQPLIEAMHEEDYAIYPVWIITQGLIFRRDPCGMENNPHACNYSDETDYCNRNMKG